MTTSDMPLTQDLFAEQSPNTARIELTQGKVALIDAEDYARLSRWNWYYNSGYAKAYENGKRLRMHRVVLDAPEGVQVDHINGDKLDNRKANLRLASEFENQWNRGRRKDNTSGIIGVSWNRRDRLWEARLYFTGQKRFLGTFKNKVEAMLVVDRAKREMHGEFARTNSTVEGDKIIVSYELTSALFDKHQ